MSLIENIRNRQGLLIFMIGLGMLGFLVPYDAVIAMIGSGQSRDAGVVNGRSISMQEYQMELQHRKQLGFSGAQLQDEVWSDLTSSIVLDPIFEDVGLEVCDDELQELLFGSAHSPYLNLAFYSSDQNRDYWRQQFGAMLQTPQGRAKFSAYSTLIKDKRRREKFENLLTEGVYANSLEGKYEHINGERQVTFDYAFKSFSSIPDSTVEISDGDVRSYYKAHKGDKEFAQKSGRDITFMRISIRPTEEDAQVIEADLQVLANGWESADDAEAFYQANVDQPYTPQLMSRADLEADVTEATLFDQQPGTVVGPYRKGQSYRVARVERFVSQSDSASCRHILLSAANAQDEDEMALLHSRADSLTRALRNGASFKDLAARFSEDPGSKDNGGEYLDFPRGQMVPAFNDFCFDNKRGEIGAVDTRFGVHLIEVLGHSPARKQVEVVFISQDILPSTNTVRTAYDSGRDVATSVHDRESFMTAAGDAGYPTNIATDVESSATSISGLRSAGPVVSWAFSAKEGEISQPLEIDGNYIIAYLDLIKVAGEPPFTNVEDRMRTGAVQKAKGEMYAERMNGNDITSIASSVGVSALTATGIALKNPNIRTAGTKAEPVVVGLAFAIEAGQISNPIIGENGVWVIAPQSVTEAATKTDYLKEQTSLLNRAKGGLSTRLTTALLESGDIEDLRDAR
jgi:peptidyl-prolyl cis-trans isomerase D